MALYRIAELNILANPQNPRTIEYFREYEIPDGIPDITVAVTDELLAYERTHSEEPCSEWVYESVAILRVVCDRIVEQYHGFFLHCSCLRMDGEGYVFTAPSGTGKSTHARMWREVFGSRVEMINDDKPLVRMKAGIPIIYGTPWNGKHFISDNISAPIKAIFFLEQAEKNSVEPMEPIDALTALLRQTVIPTDKAALSDLLDMLSAVLQYAQTFRLRCTISHEAALTAYRAVKQVKE